MEAAIWATWASGCVRAFQAYVTERPTGQISMRNRKPETGTALAAAVRRAGLGMDIVTVKELLGHTNINCTMRYAHSNDDAKRRADGRPRTSDKVVTIVERKAEVAV
jgi:hypothetical protein